MGLSTSAQSPQVKTTDEMPLTENMTKGKEKTYKEEEKISKEEETTSKEEENMSKEATTTLPTLSSLGKAACCHQGLARYIKRSNIPSKLKTLLHPVS